jgi:hypothetical protein
VVDLLTSWFWSGDTLRSRSVSDVVPSDVLDLPAPPPRLLADWERDARSILGTEPGNVECLSVARTRARWPALSACVAAMGGWMRMQGMTDVLTASDMALMACRGARYHHDGVQYGGSAFCNLFLSEDRGLDLHFATTGHRIPLTRGTAVIFDTCQPHAVVPRGSSVFDAARFPSGLNCTQVFLTWELPMEQACVAGRLEVAFDTRNAIASPPKEEQVWLNGAEAVVCADSGRWRLARSASSP